MSVSKEAKKAVADQLQQELPLMDIEKTRNEFLAWLNQMKFPGYGQVDSWEDWIYLSAEEPSEDIPTSGTKVRLSVKFYTSHNRYLISILEPLDIKSRETYIICVHTGWKDDERRFQKRIEKEYTGEFNENLRAKHTVWAQTFRDGELIDALNACGAAILARELAIEPPSDEYGTPIKLNFIPHPEFPEKNNSDK
ncbi:MAG: hypothetical protein V3V99_02525 [candidate division Zixibacteria bacterium]